jgi:hypothetical protein
MFKNTASQKVAVYAYDSTTGLPITGDAANITARISLDGAAVAQSDDVNPTELDATYAEGVYVFDLTQAETNCDLFVLSAESSTANIICAPITVYTTIGVPGIPKGVELIFSASMVNADDELQIGKTVVAQISKEGGAFTTLTTAVTETPAASSQYKVTATATEMNCDWGQIRLTNSSCKTKTFDFRTS